MAFDPTINRLFLFSQAMGSCHFCLDDKKSAIPQVFCISGLLSKIFVITHLIYVTYLAKDSRISLLFLLAISIISIVSNFYASLKAYMMRDSIYDVVEILRKSEAEFQSKGLAISYPVWDMLPCLPQLVLIGIRSVVEIISSERDLVFYTRLIISCLAGLNIIGLFQFPCGLLRVVTYQMKHVLDLHSFSPVMMARFHCQLRSAVRTVDTIFSTPLLLVLVALGANMMLNIYNLMLLWQKYSFGSMVYLKAGLDFLLPCHIVFVVTQTTVGLSREVEDFNLRLLTIAIDYESKDKLNSDDLSVILTINENVSLKGFGFFGIDRELIHAMVATASTYLIILIQIVLPKENQKS